MMDRCRVALRLALCYAGFSGLLLCMAACEGSVSHGNTGRASIDLSGWTLTLSGCDIGFKMKQFHADSGGYWLNFTLDRDKFVAATNTTGTAALSSGTQWVKLDFDFISRSMKNLVVGANDFRLDRRGFAIMEDKDPPRPDYGNPEVLLFISSDGESYAYMSIRMVYPETANYREGGGAQSEHLKGKWDPEAAMSYQQAMFGKYGDLARKNDVSQIKVIRR